jgi:hypothetical protein
LWIFADAGLEMPCDYMCILGDSVQKVLKDSATFAQQLCGHLSVENMVIWLMMIVV